MWNHTSLRRIGRGLLSLVVVALLACQQKSPDEALLAETEPVGSWLAALQMTGEKWAANSVPTSFVKNSVAAAKEEFENVAEQATQSKARPELRASVNELVSAALSSSEGLRRAVEANDRSAAARETAQLQALLGRLQALAKGG